MGENCASSFITHPPTVILFTLINYFFGFCVVKFHIHVVHTSSVIHPGIVAGKAILLDSVIDNIKLFGDDYYQKCALTYQTNEEHEVFGDICRANK